MQSSVSHPLGKVSGRLLGQKFVANAKKRDYGSGRQRLGIPDEAPPTRQQTADEPAPTLGEYLKFGRLMGERAHEVQRQLDINGAEVRVDEQSQKYLDDWQSEQLSAYSMFEALVNEDVSGSSRSANESDTLVRNKNRVALRSQSLDKFVQRQFGVGPERPVSAADRKLARNKTRAKGFTSSSSSSSSSSGVDGGEGGGNEFELLSPKRAAVVVLSGKPLRPPGAFDQQKEDLFDDISDAEWDEGTSTDEDSDGEDAVPASYEDFEAALSAAAPLKKPKGSNREGSVTLRLADLPRRPRAPPPAQLVQKPVARPGMAEAAQPLPPPPPPQLAGPPKPRSPEQLPAVPVAPPPLLKKPPGEVKKAVVAKKPPPPPPPPVELMKAPVKPVPAAAVVPAPVAASIPPPVVSITPPPAVSITPPPPAAAAIARPPPIPQPVAPIPSKVVVVVPSEPLGVAPVAAVVKEETTTAVAPVEEVAEKKEEVEEKGAVQQVTTASTTVATITPTTKEVTTTATIINKPAPPPSPPSQSRTSKREQPQKDNERFDRRARSLTAAEALRSGGNGSGGVPGQTQVSVWQINAAGVLVSEENGDIFGFIPLTELSHAHVSAVLAEEKRILAENPVAERSVGRRAAMSILRNQQFLVQVLAVDRDSGHVILSERAADRSLARLSPQTLSPEVLALAATMVGELVTARIRNVRPFGVFLDFMLGELPAFGLVHTSEISWDTLSSSPALTLTAGQEITARLTHVDISKGRIFLSIRRATANPLLQTLDSLLSSSVIPRYDTTTTTTTTTDSTTNRDGGVMPVERQTLDAAVDVRPFMGDMDVAVKFAESVLEVEGVISAELGSRLEGRASSPGVEIYMAKDATTTTSSSSGGSGDDEGPTTYKLVLRQGRDVQEVKVLSTLQRAALREVAAELVAGLRTESQ